MSFEKLKKEDQDRIINCASELFARFGYDKASMKDIAEAAGISKSVLFKYFTTKENLYIRLFRMASDHIREADEIAYVESAGDLFSLLRKSAKSRLSLFKEYPWIYRFSYTAAFDSNPLVKALFHQELERHRAARPDGPERLLKGSGDSGNAMTYRGLRDDLSPAIAKQIILWISQGYLEDKLFKGETDAQELEKGFEAWIEILELILKKNESGLVNEERKGKDHESGI